MSEISEVRQALSDVRHNNAGLSFEVNSYNVLVDLGGVPPAAKVQVRDEIVALLGSFEGIRWGFRGIDSQSGPPPPVAQPAPTQDTLPPPSVAPHTQVFHRPNESGGDTLAS